MMWRIAAGVVLIGGLVGCAGPGAQVASREMVVTKAAIGAAEEAGAGEGERASLHLRVARERLYQARKMMEVGDDKEAAEVLRQAREDANRSLALAQEEQREESARRGSPTTPVFGQQLR